MIEEASILSDLECPTCHLTPRSSPIYQCGNGHLVCSECRPRLLNCPICNIHYTEDLLIRNILSEKMLEKVGTTIEEAAVLSDLECPVCYLTPRSSPIYQCSNGHLVCSECYPILEKCPVCNINYVKDIILRNTFAEKMLWKVERRCRYELVGCTFKSRSSYALIEHEMCCGLDCGANSNVTLLVKNFVLLVFLLRCYIIVISNLKYDYGIALETFLAFMIIGNFFTYLPIAHPVYNFICAYIFVVVLVLQTAKMYYGSLAMAGFLWYFKPAVTLLTGIFCSLKHIYLYGYRARMVHCCVVLSSICLAGIDEAEILGDVPLLVKLLLVSSWNLFLVTGRPLTLRSFTLILLCLLLHFVTK